MLLTSNLSFSYSSSVAFQFPDLSVEESAHLLVLGRSGVGKTTLLHLLAGFLQAKSGSVSIDGEVSSTQRAARRDRIRAEKIGMIYQVPHFIASLTLEENIFWAQKLAGQKVDRQRVEELLTELNLDHRKKAKISRLSQGELQRASIIRGIIHQPKLILADEPTSSLDDENCQAVINMLEHQRKKVNAALVVVTHDSRLKEFFTQTVSL